MAAGITAVASSLGIHRLCRGKAFSTEGSAPRSLGNLVCLFDPLLFAGRGPRAHGRIGDRKGAAVPLHFGRKRKSPVAVCFVVAEDQKRVGVEEEEDKWAGAEGGAAAEAREIGLEQAVALGASAARAAERQARKKAERYTYLVAAVLSSVGITSMAAAAVYYRFSWQMEGGEVPLTEMFGTFALSVGAAVGMEFWARWAHRALWHASLWHMHESHHRPRDGPFELNDVFAIINAVPAISLLSYGFFHRGLIPGLCFGAGLGITLFGMAYMFIHDGLVHRRFPVGPIADVPYLRRVAAAHQIHHSDKFDGVPYGLFLGPKELEEVGGMDELQREINRRIKCSSSRSSSSYYSDNSGGSSS